MTQFVAARRIIPGHSGCQAGVTDASATYRDVLTPNCWGRELGSRCVDEPSWKVGLEDGVVPAYGPESECPSTRLPAVPAGRVGHSDQCQVFVGQEGGHIFELISKKAHGGIEGGEASAGVPTALLGAPFSPVATPLERRLVTPALPTLP